MRWPKDRRSDEELCEQHRAARAQEWDDWAMWEGMEYGIANKEPRKRAVLQVEMSSGSEDAREFAKSLRFPANVAGDTTLRLRMTLQRETPEEDVDSSSVGPTSNRAGGTS